MPISAKPYRQKAFATVKGRRMAYIEADTGNAIVFQHGNPTSSYLWRNIMPHCEGLGRLIACDLIGMGDSDKLENSGAGRYTYVDHRDYLFALWDQIGLGDKVIMVLHDWGSALGFDWAMRNRDRVQGIVYMEAIITPLTWADWPENARRAFQRSDPKAVKRWFWRKTYSLNGCCPAPSYAGSVRRRWPLTAGPSLIRARTAGPRLHGHA